MLTVHRPDLAELYYGLVADLFTCDESMHKVIEAVVKNKVFMHVVETDDIATKILAEMNERNMPGSPMFIAMNRIRVDNTQPLDATHLIYKLQFDEKFEVVMRHVFGKILICRDLECAVEMARKQKQTCVTMDGDIVHSIGPITGGYIPPKATRLDTYRDRCEAKSSLNQLENKLIDNQQQQERLIIDLEAKRTLRRENCDRILEIRNAIQADRSKLASRRRRLTGLKNRRDAKLAAMQYNEERLAKLMDEKQMLETEYGQPWLSAEEQARADQLSDSIEQLQLEYGQLNQHGAELSRLCSEKSELLAEELIPRHEEITERWLKHPQMVSRSRELCAQRTVAEQQLQTTADLLQAQCTLVNEDAMKIEENKEAIKQLLNARKELKNHVMLSQREFDTVAQNEVALSEKISQKLAEIPDEDVPMAIRTEFGDSNELDLQAALTDTIQRINGFHANISFMAGQKELDDFYKQRASLGKRCDEMIMEKSKIDALMEQESRKICESISTTMQLLQQNLSNIFKRFVPRGFATATLLVDEAVDRDDVRRFEGVELSASFTTEKVEHALQLDQLDDQQKPVLFLSLAFAIQKCNPSPFYFFDCIERVSNFFFFLSLSVDDNSNFCLIQCRSWRQNIVGWWQN